MLFSSYEFIFVFLPVTLVLYGLLGRFSRDWALAWVILASFAFYTWWRPMNLAIIAPSLIFNYLCGLVLLRLAADPAKQATKNVVLAIGIAFNVLFLGYFKYANFAVTVANDVTGADFVLEQIILPLGISFITFQKIAFLVDVSGGRIERFTFRDYLLFVMFFPQLIAGPIVHYRESVPQFQNPVKVDGALIATALTLFVFGLAKKVLLADGIALHVTPIYAAAAAGEHISFVHAWLAAVGFTLQIYFDFSGYSDMACGAALLFGIRLPINFDSPLRATNIIDFWLRWHMTLTRFLTAYVYNPITLAITRWRAKNRKPLFRQKRSALFAFLHVVAWPTMVTMLLSGVWHGAGYTFIFWGALHGLYLVINHAWRQYGAHKPGALTIPARAIGWALTFTGVVVAMVFFRAPDMSSAWNIISGLVGGNGLALPARLAEAAPISVATMTLAGNEVYLPQLIQALAYLVGLLAIALMMPNTSQMLADYEPLLRGSETPPRIAGIGPLIRWRPRLHWMLFVGALGAVAVLRLSGESEFLYWQF